MTRWMGPIWRLVIPSTFFSGTNQNITQILTVSYIVEKLCALIYSHTLPEAGIYRLVWFILLYTFQILRYFSYMSYINKEAMMFLDLLDVLISISMCFSSPLSWQHGRHWETSINEVLETHHGQFNGVRSSCQCGGLRAETITSDLAPVLCPSQSDPLPPPFFYVSFMSCVAPEE